jgi:hypothetical protein
MPNPNVGQRIAANWEAVVGTKPEDAIHDDYWLLNQLSKGGGFKGLSGGDFITGPIEYALNTTVDSYSDMDTISTTRVDVFDRFEYQWKEVAGTYVCSDLELDRNAGEGQVFDLQKAKLQNLKDSMRGELNAQMHADGTGTGGKDLDGLGNLVATTPTSGTVGGINRANFTFWRNKSQSGVQTAAAFDNLRAVMRSIYNQCSQGVGSEHPTFAVTTRTVFEGYEGLLIANERFTDKDSGEGGFANDVLKFKGCKLSYDNDATAGELRFLNPKFLKLVYKTGAWMKMQPPVRPANQTIDIALVRTMANLIATNPRRLGAVVAIT